VVEVGGDSDGTFTTGDARIAAGAYDYTLVKGNRAGDKNWYLTSDSDDVNPHNTPDHIGSQMLITGDKSGTPVSIEKGGDLTISGNGKIGSQTHEGAGTHVSSNGRLQVEQGGTVEGSIDVKDDGVLDLGTQQRLISTVSGGVAMADHARGTFGGVNVGGHGVSLADDAQLTTAKSTYITAESGNGITMSGDTRLSMDGGHVLANAGAGLALGSMNNTEMVSATGSNEERRIELNDATVQGLKGAAIVANSGLNTIDVVGSSQLLSGNNTLLDTAQGATVNFNLSDSQQGDIINQGSTHVVFNRGAELNGAMQNVSDVSMDTGGYWSLTGASSVGGNLVNDGSIVIEKGFSAGNTLTVGGNYIGHDGHMVMGTQLGGDNSLTDKLIVKGNTGGNTRVTIRNAGGSGAQTVDGIEIISVGGKSDGVFTSDGRITAGAYDYTLARGTGGRANNWYLTSQQGAKLSQSMLKVHVDKDITAGDNWLLQNGQNEIAGGVRNSGKITVGGKDSTPGNTLTVNGNYYGNNGLVSLNTRLEGDNSLTDKMVIKGDTSGHTMVDVNNVGGTGAKTLNGIELIDVAGKSEGEFYADGRITAGAYDYTLQRGAGQNNKNWYLDSELTKDMSQDSSQESTITPVIHHVVRPEAGSYSANMQASNTLFAMDLQDRTSTEAGARHSNGLWLRQKGEHNHFHDNSGQLTVTGNRYVAQLGGDLINWSSNGTDQTEFGVMVGYGNSHNQSNSRVSGYSSKGSVQGYNTGAYWTWRANAVDKTGLYADSWLQYSWFNNDVNGEKIAAEHYKSRGASASLELGDAILLGTSGNRSDMTRFFIEPHAQAIWMGVKADHHTEANGTTVNSEGENNVQTHVGMTTYLEKLTASNVRYKPFVDMNWVHNTRAFGAKMNGVSGTVDGARNAGEVGIGIEGNVSRSLALTAGVSQTLGEKGYSDTTGELGVKYNF
jgi:autotransporter family porin